MTTGSLAQPLRRSEARASLPRMDRDYSISNEGEREEWKAAPGGDLIERGLQTASAFLNTYGGRVIYGVDSTGKAVPIAGDLDRAQLAITNQIQNHVKPNARAFIDVAVHDGRIYLFVRQDPSRIYTYRNVVYRRVGSSTVALNFQQAKELEDQRKDHVQENAPGVFTRQARGEVLRCRNGHTLVVGTSMTLSIGEPPGPQLCSECGQPLLPVR